MRLLYYITSHGYGHGVRSCAVINALSPDVEVTVRSVLPAGFLRAEIRRPFSHEPAEFDCGCVQDDSVRVDIAATVKRYTAIAARNRSLLDAEASWLRAQRIDVIASDSTPFAFEAAQAAGIPSAAVTNFTWYDIYRPYAETFPAFAPTVEEIRRQYASASLCLELAPACPMPYFPRRQCAGVVGRVGTDRSALLRRRLGIGDSRRLGLIYPGNFGLGGMAWRELERFTGWEFIGLYALPDSPRNFHAIMRDEFPYQDLAASCHLVVSKLGYVTVAECMLNGTPLLYLPRESFAEYAYLKRGIDEWGFGICLDAADYQALRWNGALAAAPPRSRVRRAAPGGARACALALESLIRRRGA